MDLRIASDLLLGATAVVYAGSSALFFLQLAGKSTWVRAGKVALGAGATLHLAHFFLNSYVQRACPVQGIHHATSLMAIAIALIYLVASRRFRIDAIGAFIAPITLAALLAARFLGTPDAPKQVRNTILPFHVTSVLLASAFFTIASALAIAYLLQERRLKSKKGMGLLPRWPPLDVLEKASQRFLIVGFPLLTIGILTGLLWIGKIKVDPVALLRQVLAYAAWIVFGAVLTLRSSGRWRGRRAAWGTIVGFGLALTVFLVYLVRSTRGVGG